MAPRSGFPTLQDEAPEANSVTNYDRAHFPWYVRLLDASSAGASDGDICREVLGIDVEKEPDRARKMLESHLKRARWMTQQGYRQLLP
jgi:hypothetical protein